MVDVHHSSFSRQHPGIPAQSALMREEYFAGETMPHSPMFAEDEFAQHEDFEGEDSFEDVSFSRSDFGGHSRKEDVRSFLIPFEIDVVPSNMTEHHATWKVKTLFPEPFNSPGNKELGDECILKGVDLFDVSHNFPSKVAIQVSMRDSKVDESVKNDPENPEGERIQGQMQLGSFKKMPVHYTLRPNTEKEYIPISENRGNYSQSFLETYNERCISRGQKAWDESDLRSKGVLDAKKGKFLVEKEHPVVDYISAVYPDGQVMIESAGADHVKIGKKAFNEFVHDLINEAAANIKLKDVRENLRIFVMRPIPNNGPMSESTWKESKGFLDNVMDSATSETVKEKMLNKTYNISGNLSLSYIPLKIRRGR